MSTLELTSRFETERFKRTALRYLNDVYSSALRLTRDAQLAEELTVAVYARLAKNYFNRFKNAAALRQWLYRELLRSTLAGQYRPECCN